MKEEIRTVAYDAELRVKAYRFEGVAQPFQNHFHEYYVIGLVEDGERVLSCKDRRYTIQKGNVLLFAPGDCHACVQSGGALDYRGFNITKQVVLELTERITGRRELPVFSRSVIFDEEVNRCLRPLHELVMKGLGGAEKEEGLLRLLSLLIRQYGRLLEEPVPECREEVEKACAFMEERYAERLSLAQICRCVGLSSSTLLRAFVGAKGVTPYDYLKNIRIGKAGGLLEQGLPPAEVALRTGFFDQSHFTNCFIRSIGLTPGAYRNTFINREERQHGSAR